MNYQGRNKKTIIIFSMLLIGALLTACVQETTNSFEVNKSEDKAFDNYITLAYGYLREGQREFALRNIENAFELKPNAVEAHNAMAMYYQMDQEI